MPPPAPRSLTTRLAVALLVWALALVATVTLAPMLGRTLFVFFWGAVVVSAWYGGVTPAVLVAVLAALAVDYLILEPHYALFVKHEHELASMLTFLAVSLVTGSLTGALRSQQERTTAALREAGQLTEQLLQQAAELEAQTEEAQALTEELEMSNTEMRQATLDAEEARDAAEHARRHLEQAFDALPDVVAVYDRDWRCTYLNPATNRFLHTAGLAPDALRGRIIWEVLPWIAGTRFHAAAVQALAERRVVEFDAYAPAPFDRWFENHMIPMVDGVISHSRDITTRKREAEQREQLLQAEHAARKEAEAATEHLTRLHRVVGALSRSLTPREVAAVVLREGGAALGAASGAVCALTADGTSLEILRATAIADDLVEEFRCVPLDAPLPLAEAVRTGTPLFLSGRAEIVQRYPGLAEANARGQSDAWIALPFVVGGHVLGGMAFGFATARDFTPEEREFALALSAQCALAFERARLLDAERRARAEAETANRAKTEFLAVMSHELRTPLNAIAGYSELMELEIHGPITAEQREALQRIRRSQRHLLGLINDVLNFAKLEAGHVVFALERVNVREAFDALDPLIAPQLRAKALHYASECDTATAVYADAEKMRQILVNLLSNAIKFTPEGGLIAVGCAVVGDCVAVRVRDTGIGIPADKLDQVFSPFVQVDRRLTSAHDGTGLGLAISRDLARAMGGDLAVESEEGMGATFTLTLPRG